MPGNESVTFIEDYKEATLIALSHYPELKDCKITFRKKSIDSTAKTTIYIPSLFTSQRNYLIFINTNRKQTGFLLTDCTVDIQTGIIGHELMHVVDFETKSVLQLIGWVIMYLIQKGRKKIERGIDTMTIRHGLGDKLLAWNTFVMTNPSTSEKYRKAIVKYYLHPEEIKELLR